MRHFALGALASMCILLGATAVRPQAVNSAIDVPFTTELDNLRAEIPSYVLADMVRQSVTASIQPRDQPTTAYILADALPYSWLPDIPNVVFVIIPQTDRAVLHERGVRDYYSFPRVEQSGWNYTIEFGYGSRCHAEGSSYTFRWRRGHLTRDDHGNGGYFSNTNHCDPDAP